MSSMSVYNTDSISKFMSKTSNRQPMDLGNDQKEAKPVAG